MQFRRPINVYVTVAPSAQPAEPKSPSWKRGGRAYRADNTDLLTERVLDRLAVRIADAIADSTEHAELFETLVGNVTSEMDNLFYTGVFEDDD
jgi:hypothetical protein